MWNKVKESGLVLTITILILIGFYMALPEVKLKSKHVTAKGTKTVEEIIAGSYTKNYTPDTTEWDNSFKSSITLIKEENGN